MYYPSPSSTAAAVAAAIAATVGVVLFSRAIFLRRLRSIPGPNYNFFLGAVEALTSNEPSFAQQRHLVLRDLHERYGPVFKIVLPLGRGAMLCYSKLDDVASAFKDSEVHPSRPNTSSSPFPRGMLALPTGPTWRAHRSAALPALSTKALKHYHPSIVAFADQMCDMLETRTSTTADVDVYQPLTGATLQIISSIGFGVDLGVLDEVLKSPLMTTGGALLDGQVAMLTVPHPVVKVIRALPRALMPESQRRMMEAIDVFSAQARALYSKMHADAKLKRVLSGDACSPVASEEAKSLLEALAHAELPYTEAIDTIMTLLVAGHETTANTLSWTLLLLAQHQDKQALALEEINRVCPPGEPLTFDQLSRLAYVRGCFFEALRLYSTVPNVGRTVKADTRVGAYVAPSGSTLVYSIACAARDPTVFDDAAAFDPTRHGKAADGHAWAPFGPQGPRKCLGYRLADAEGIAFLSTVIRRFHVHLPSAGAPEPVAYTDATCGPKHTGLQLRLTPRAVVQDQHVASPAC
mmetsp:Transcript_23147/g.62757  ORF Transcript_23147/g.62757 Transcript_23147/m.62757 type:complete len:522 (-) Transcript_23147:287-1852(-)